LRRGGAKLPGGHDVPQIHLKRVLLGMRQAIGEEFGGGARIRGALRAQACKAGSQEYRLSVAAVEGRALGAEILEQYASHAV
jgi:hypothetical protein